MVRKHSATMSPPLETIKVFLLCACFNMFPPVSVGQPAKPSLAKKQQLSASGGVDFHRLNMRPRACACGNIEVTFSHA